MASKCDMNTEDLKYLLGRCMEKLEDAELTLEHIVEMEGKVCERGTEVQEEIKRTADGMIDTIQMRRCEMTAQVRSAMKAKQKALHGQRSKLCEYIETLRTSIEYSHDVLNNNESDGKEWQGALLGVLREMEQESIEHEPAANDNFELTVSEEEHMFDLQEFFTKLCTRSRSHLTSNGQLKC